jgi:antitoxin VapB
MRVTAKLFRSGRSQAVRLPKEFRFEGDEVRIRREGRRVVLEPMEVKPSTDDWAWLDELRAQLPDDFFDSIGGQEEPEEQAGLEQLFS